jgi:hypothetical protein
MYALEWFPQPATPHVEVFGSATSPAYYVAIGRAPYSQLPPEDLALLADDPGLRSRYCELCVHLLLPGLRRLYDILATKSHLNESLPPERLDPVFPGVGRGWKALIGSLTLVYSQMRVHAAQFESLAARWEQPWAVGSFLHRPVYFLWRTTDGVYRVVHKRLHRPWLGGREGGSTCCSRTRHRRTSSWRCSAGT